MKLKNVHYKYLENDTWRIYFNDYKECEAFQNERSDGKKPMCSAFFTNKLGIRYYVEAKLTGQFNVLRHYVRDSADKYSSSHPWTKLVKKIEGADSDYIFDEIDLWYDATSDKCYFRICCMNGTWTDLFAKNMLNSQFGTTAQLNDEQLKVWEAALGIDKLPKHKKEKTVGDVVNELTEDQKKVLYYLIAEAQKSGKAETPEPTKILVQGTATIIWWSDGTKTVVKCQKGDKMDPEKGIAMCVMKKFMGTNETHSNYLDFAKDAIAKYEKQQAAEKAKKKAEADKRRRAAAKKKGADKEES